MLRQQIQELYDQYVTAEDTVIFPERITSLVRQSEVERYGKVTSRKHADSIVDFTVALAGAAILLGKPEGAKAALLAGFRLVNGAKFRPEYWGHECGCMCDIVERLGYLANNLGFPDIAASLGPATQCPTSPSGYRPHISPRQPPAMEEIQKLAHHFLQHLSKET